MQPRDQQKSKKKSKKSEKLSEKNVTPKTNTQLKLRKKLGERLDSLATYLEEIHAEISARLPEDKEIDIRKLDQIINELTALINKKLLDYKEKNKLNNETVITIPEECFNEAFQMLLYFCNLSINGDAGFKIEGAVKIYRPELIPIINLFEMLNKHIDILKEVNASLNNITTTDFLAYYGERNKLHPLYLRVIIYHQTDMQINTSDLEHYLKLYKSSALSFYNRNKDYPLYQASLHSSLATYNAGKALCKVRRGDFIGIKGLLVKADSHLTQARSAGLASGGGLLDKAYELLIEHLLRDKNYKEALRFAELRYDALNEATQCYQKIMTDFKTKKIAIPAAYGTLENVKNLYMKELTVFIKASKQLDEIKALVELKEQEEIEKRAQKVSTIDTTEIDEIREDEEESIKYSKQEAEEPTKPSLKERKQQENIEKSLRRKAEREAVSIKEAKNKRIQLTDSYVYNSLAQYSDFVAPWTMVDKQVIVIPELLQMAFKLWGAVNQYVVVTQELIDQVNQEDESIRVQLLHWIFTLCDIGKVLGNSRGKKGFLLNVFDKDRSEAESDHQSNNNMSESDQKKSTESKTPKNAVEFIKGKDSSKKWRLFGKSLGSVQDDKGNHHTVWALTAINTKHK